MPTSDFYLSDDADARLRLELGEPCRSCQQLAEPSESGRDGIDAAFVQGVLEQVCEAGEAKTLFTGFMITPDGGRIQVDFSVRKGATQPEKDLEFFAALCQEVQIDYLELGAYADQAK